MKNLDLIRVSGVAALLLVALALGGVWYELHKMRSGWSPRVFISPARQGFGHDMLQIEIKEPVTIETTPFKTLDVDVQ